MVMDKELNQLKPIFQSCPKIKLVYFFGSRANGQIGPLSDYDFAVYFDEREPKKMFDLKFDLQNKISRTLKTDNLDLIILNLTKSPELKYEIIKNGRLIYEKEPFKILIEPKILNEYFDFYFMLKKYNLTKA